MKILPSVFPTINSASTNKSPKVFLNTSQGIDSVTKTTMISNPDYIPSKMFLSLLKSGLHDGKVDSSLFKGRTSEEWIRMYNLGHRNAVTPILLDGLRKNPNIKVPNEVLENMKINEEFVKKYHMSQERALGDLIKISSSEGIDTVPIKGIGFSLNYPDPQKRYGGDIDIFNFRHGSDFSNPENNMSYMFDEICARKGAKIDVSHPKHSEFRYRGIPIENHRHFVDVDSKIVKVPMAKEVDKYLMKVLNPTEKVLPMGTKVLVPSKEFDNVFLAFHSMTHFLLGGINFHHLADWSVQIKKNSLVIPDEFKKTPVETFMNAMTSLSNKYLGTNVKVPENKLLEDAIIDRILDPERLYSANQVPKPKTKNPLRILKYKYDVIKSGEKIKESLLGKNTGSVTREVLKSIKSHLLNPKSFKHVIKL